MKKFAILAMAALMGPALAGCAPMLAIGTGAVVGKAVVEEKSAMAALTDTEIKLSISNRLMNVSPRLFGDVTVDVVEGRVLLIGSVPERSDKVEAVRIAWETDGVSSVADELTVAEDGGTQAYLEDVRISNTLRWELFIDSDISSANYNVETVDRVVYLSGLAKSREELAKVIRLAQSIKGVERVVSHVLTIDDPRRVAAVATTS